MWGLVINKSGSDAGIPTCNSKTSMPVVQDKDDALWDMLGIPYNSLAIIDQQGNLAHKLVGGSLPASEQQVLDAVNALLQ